MLELQNSHSKGQAANLVSKELTAIWHHHFGPGLILGKGHGHKGYGSKGLLIYDHFYIVKKVTNLAEQ